VRSLFVLVIVAAGLGCSIADPQPVKPPPQQEEPKEIELILPILIGSKRPDELGDALNALVREKSSGALDHWVKFMQDPRFLQRLDPDPRYPFRRERLERVLEPIARLPAAKANQMLLNLSVDKGILEEPERLDALMRSCGHVRQPSDKLLDFLDQQAVPDSWQANGIVAILARMRSDAACRRIEKRFLAPETEYGRKFAWLTHELLEVRNDRAIVALLGRLLKASAKDAELRDLVVLATFDYRPTEWYDVRRLPIYPKPPARNEASTEALDDLVRIADDVLTMDLSVDVKESVQAERKAIQAILKFRQSGEPERVAKLITHLNSDQFPIREKAMLELTKLGERAGPILRKALRSPQSSEVRNRLELLVAKIAVIDDQKQIDDLIASLDVEDVQSQRRRRIAVRQLRQYGELAGPALFKALPSAKSTQGKELMQGLLADLDN
jgi:hypothetical protein